MLESLLRVAVGLIVVYAALLLLAWRFQERLAFPGARGSLMEPALAGLPEGEIAETTAADGTRLRGWYLPPRPLDPPRLAPGLLWFYGNMETVSALAPVIRQLRPPGTALLILDYRGYGESAGSPSEAGLYADAEAAWTLLASRPGVDPHRIAVYGRSVGSVPALYVATKHPVRAVALDSPLSNAADMARLHYPFLPRFILRLSLDNVTRAQRLSAPLLVFQGAEDRVVPVGMGRAVADAGRARELVLIHGAGHNQTYDMGGSAYREKLHGFFRQTLR